MKPDGINRYPLLDINGSLDTFGAADRKLAEFILDDPRTVINSTIEELVARSGSSYATVYRFCRKLGYRGFKDLKKRLIDDVVRQTSEEHKAPEFDVIPGLTPHEVIDRTCRFSERVLKDTEDFLDPASVSTAADAVINANQVLFIGAGMSALTARYAYIRFFRLGISCLTEPDPVVFTMRASTLGTGDLLFCVSSSGRTTTVVDAAGRARERGVPVVGVSDHAVSPLSRLVDAALYTTPRTSNNFVASDTQLLIGQIMIIDALFGVVTTRVPERAGSIYRETTDAANRLKS